MLSMRLPLGVATIAGARINAVFSNPVIHSSSLLLAVALFGSDAPGADL